MSVFCILLCCVAEQFARFPTVQIWLQVWPVASQKLVTSALTLITAPFQLQLLHETGADRPLYHFGDITYVVSVYRYIHKVSML